MKTARLSVSLAALLGSFGGWAAESAFVIDKLLVGIHQDEDLNSAIVKVLPTGSKLDVLVRKGEVARVKDAAGVVGWVDAAYLMAEPPAATQLAKLKQDKQALADRIKVLESAGEKGAAPSGKVDSLTNENTDLKSQLSAQKLKNSELESELGALRKSAAAGPAGGTVAAELQNANLKLTAELETARETIETLKSQVATPGPLGEVKAAVGLATPGAWAVLAALVAAGFGGGVFVMDYLNRRRHGGFRV